MRKLKCNLENKIVRKVQVIPKKDNSYSLEFHSKFLTDFTSEIIELLPVITRNQGQ